MDARDGRLYSRTPPARLQTQWPPGLHPLAGGCLLLVPEPGEPEELLVFFHGASGRAADGLALMESLVSARGLLVLLPSSRRGTWDMVQGRTGPDVEMLDAGLAQVMAAYDVRRVALAGFSDGGTYALSLGVANGDLVEQVLAFSPGFLAPLQPVGQPRVWVSHGTADAVLPVELCGRKVVAQLRASGYDVDYFEFEGGHVITPNSSRPRSRPGSADERLQEASLDAGRRFFGR